MFTGPCIFKIFVYIRIHSLSTFLQYYQKDGGSSNVRSTSTFCTYTRFVYTDIYGSQSTDHIYYTRYPQVFLSTITLFPSLLLRKGSSIPNSTRKFLPILNLSISPPTSRKVCYPGHIHFHTSFPTFRRKKYTLICLW